MAAFADINDFMAGPWPDALAPTMLRFHRRYEVRTTPEIVLVDVHARRVFVDPVLVPHLKSPRDLALWVVAARNLVLVRAFAEDVKDPMLQWWEVAWVLAHAVNSYGFDRTTPAAMFSDTDVLGCALSLSWSKMLSLPVPDAVLRRLRTVHKAAESYTTWMDLGEEVLDFLTPPANAVPLLGLEEVTGPPEEDEDTGVRMIRVPNTDRVETRWALDALTDTERERIFPKLPSPTVLRGINNVIHVIEDLVPVLRFGHIGRREVVRHALGVPVFSGTKMEPEVLHRPWSVYVDVSGSMTAYTQAAWSFLRSLPQGSKAYAFSGVVVDADIHSDFVPSDGTTSYVAVADHILENPPGNVLVVSDDTEPLPPSTVEKLKAHCNLIYVSVRDGVKPESTLSDAACKHIILPNT